MLVSNLIEYNHFCQIGFSSVNTVIICFISEVSLRFPFKRFFSRPALDIHPVSSLWVLLHMIPWVLSSVTCKLPLVLVIIFLCRDISCLWFYLLKHVFFSPLTWNTSWQYFIHDRWWILHEFFARQRLRFHLCHFIMTIHLICQPRHSHMTIYIRCQHSLTVDHWWCFHVNLFWTPFCGSRIPGVIFLYDSY